MYNETPMLSTTIPGLLDPRI